MDNLILRRQLLKALHAAYPAPLDTEDLLSALPLALTVPAPVAVAGELKNLLAWGFVENLRHDNTRTPWWRITADGVTQITRDGEQLDQRIWGRLAV